MIRAAFFSIGCALLLAPASTSAAPSATAQYELRFDATWSVATHPSAFPPGPHFSGLIGGTHSSAVTFWTVGQLASFGIEQMAEVGSKGWLQQEIDAAITAGTADAVVSGGFIAPSPGSVIVEFTMSQAFPRLTLVSMAAPSPDWFVGVYGLELFDGTVWVSNAVVTLYPLDAGTDDGASYLSADADSSPHVPISTISSGPLGNGSPLGNFTIQRLDLDPVPATSVVQRRVLAVLLLLAGLGLMLRERLRQRRSAG
jgi:hypothetical protein